MSNHVFVPAISREVEFIGNNASVADAICDEDITVDDTVKEFTEAVYDRANDCMGGLLLALEEETSRALHGMIRIKWTNTNRGRYWRNYGNAYKAYGKKRIGSAGIFFSCYDRPLHLIGWLYPLGGLAARKRIARACVGKVECVKVASEHPKEYPDWGGSEDCVVWFDQKLTVASSRDELCRELALRAKRFFKIVKRTV